MQARTTRPFLSAAARCIGPILLAAVALSGCKNSVEEDCVILIDTYCNKIAECSPTPIDVANCKATQEDFIDCKRLQATYDSCTHDWDYCAEDIETMTCAQVAQGTSALPDSCRRISSAPCTRGPPTPP